MKALLESTTPDKQITYYESETSSVTNYIFTTVQFIITTLSSLWMTFNIIISSEVRPPMPINSGIGLRDGYLLIVVCT